MKKIINIYTVLMIFFFTASYFFLKNYSVKQIPVSLSKEDKKEAENKNIPNDHSFIQRTYPNKTFDWQAYEQGRQAVQKKFVEQKQASSHQKTKSQAAKAFFSSWINEGPNNLGGRVNVVVAEPINHNVMYIGLPKGGVFKTTDGGNNWFPIFDQQSFLSIGSIAIDPNNTNTLYVGTGDPNISQSLSTGDGIYKSMDGGATWQHMGLVEQKIISKIIIDPNNSNIIYAACMGNPFIRDNHRGVYRSLDGGNTWQQILFIASDAGVIDMVMSPFDSNILYAAGWNRIRNLQESVTYGDDAKIFKTTDGGATWNILTNGLPNYDCSRIGLAISQVSPNTVFALYVGSNHELDHIYKSLDGGTTWTAITLNTNLPTNPLGGFGWYFGKIAVNPTNDHEIYLLGVDLYKTINGGATWSLAAPSWGSYQVHADKHDLHFINSDVMLLATDGGVYMTTDRATAWMDIENIPHSQFYRIAINPHEPGVYYGGMQDNGTSKGHTNMQNSWPRIFGGDGFQMVFHPTNPNTFYVETQNGRIYATTNGGSSFSNRSSTISDTRRNWDMPYIMSASNPNTLYTGTYRMYKNTNAPADNWIPISGDLTDGVIYGTKFHTISAIAESAINTNYLYAGTSDGNVWRSLDGGMSWDNVSVGLPDHYVTSIQTSPNDASTVYVTLSGYKGNAYIPHVHRSRDNGNTWEDISGDLPQVAVNDIVILPDNSKDDILFVAVDGGVYTSFNAGVNWSRLGNNMPFISVYDITYDSINRKLIAGTYARSMMSIDLEMFVNFDAPNGVPVKLKALLEGAYLNNGQMAVSSDFQTIIPLDQPFNQAPWHYSGNEYLGAIPSNMIDWVLVEVRDANNPTLVVETKAGILLNNGDIVDANFFNVNIAVYQNNELIFSNLLPNETYHISIKHRNHLAITTNDAVRLPNHTTIDFSQALIVKGSIKQLATTADGFYTLAAGDINANGVISVEDFNDYQKETAQTNLYLNSDTNLDHTNSVADFNIYRPNASRIAIYYLRY